MLGFRALVLAAGALAAPALPQAPSAPKPLSEDRAAGAAEITGDVVWPWLEELTSPGHGGRGTGSAGFARAATLMRDHFESLGLEPAGDAGDYWQQVPWTQVAADPATAVLEVRKGDEVVCRLTPGDGLYGFAASDADAEGELVVVTVDDLDLLSEVDLRGKIALVVMPEGAASGALARAMRDAAAHVRVDDRAAERSPALEGLARPDAAVANRAMRGRDLTPNSLVTTGAWLEKILAACGKRRDDADLRVGTAVPLSGLRARLHLDAVEGNAPAYNVVGILRGGDPHLAEEYVVIGSHLDHLGTSRGRMFPGADDDASGSVGVMAIARAFAKNPVKPRRSILFVTFCGEERGLIGSAYFVKSSPVPLSKVAAELQMDMIGRHEETRSEPAADNVNSLHLIGTQKISADLHALCVARNEAHAGFDLEWDQEDVFYRSDHFNFAREGVPIAFFFTGFHPDYHQTSDTPDKIDLDKLARVARYVYDIAFELASVDERPLVDAERWTALRKELNGKAPEVPAAPQRASQQQRGRG